MPSIQWQFPPRGIVCQAVTSVLGPSMQIQNSPASSFPSSLSPARHSLQDQVGQSVSQEEKKRCALRCSLPASVDNGGTGEIELENTKRRPIGLTSSRRDVGVESENWHRDVRFDVKKANSIKYCIPDAAFKNLRGFSWLHKPCTSRLRYDEEHRLILILNRCKLFFSLDGSFAKLMFDFYNICSYEVSFRCNR